MDEATVEPSEPRPHAIRRFFRQTGPAGPMALIVTALPVVGTVVLLAFARRIVPWLRAHDGLGVAAYITTFATLNGLALMTTYANSMLAGWTFKFAIGFPTVMASLAGAAMIGYGLTYRIVGHRVENAIREHPRWEIVRRALIGGSPLRTTSIITLLRLSPLLPFETTNVLLAMCGVRPLPYLIGTMIGIAPRTAAVVYFASSLQEFTLHSVPDPVTIIVGLVITAIAIAVLSVIAKHALQRACQPSADSSCER
jgi:uncharacterized membrane protein YdjX (TVP38/TMEM64 family)